MARGRLQDGYTWTPACIKSTRRSVDFGFAEELERGKRVRIFYYLDTRRVVKRVGNDKTWEARANLLELRQVLDYWYPQGAYEYWQSESVHSDIKRTVQGTL